MNIILDRVVKSNKYDIVCYQDEECRFQFLLVLQVNALELSRQNVSTEGSRKKQPWIFIVPNAHRC